MSARVRFAVAVLSTVAFSGGSASAELMMPAIFKDGVVLQWNAANVFGFADPGAKVIVLVDDNGIDYPVMAQATCVRKECGVNWVVAVSAVAMGRLLLVRYECVCESGGHVNSVAAKCAAVQWLTTRKCLFVVPTRYTSVADAKTGRWSVRVRSCADPKGEVSISVALASSSESVVAPLTMTGVTFGEVFLW